MNYVAKVLLRDSNGDLLILRRSETHPRFAFHDDLPGGMVEPDEDTLDAALREVFEETGLELTMTDLKLAHEHDRSALTKYLIYEAELTVPRPPIVISWEHDQFEWVSLSDLLARPRPTNLDSFHKMVLDYLNSTTDEE
jgi:8-oxo-dGTP diphosphatase